jgi:hypothetical protein
VKVTNKIEGGFLFNRSKIQLSKIVKKNYTLLKDGYNQLEMCHFVKQINDTRSDRDHLHCSNIV